MKNVSLHYIKPICYGFNRQKFEKLVKKLKSFHVVDFSELGIENHPIITDEYLALITHAKKQSEINCYVFNRPLEDNWFVRRTDFNGLRDGHDIRLALTTFEVSDIAQMYGYSAEKLLASIFLIACITSEYLQYGGNYYELYSNTLEDSAFNLCENKTDVIEAINSQKLGKRVELLFETIGIPESRISEFDADIKRFRETLIEKLLRYNQKHQVLLSLFINIIVATLFFILGQYKSK